MKKNKILKLGLPKGSLQEATFRMFKKAGFNVSLPSVRSYLPSINDSEIAGLLRNKRWLSTQEGALDQDYKQ